MKRRTAGTILLILGVLAWPVGFALKKPTAVILPFHLLGVVPGVLLRGSKILNRLKKN